MNENKKSFAQAVVIGSSIAGLTTARVLADHFQQVTIIERDLISEKAVYRQGVPQAKHAHTLQPQGQMILEKLFPSLRDELVKHGAVTVNPNEDSTFFENGEWHRPNLRSAKQSIYCSRPLLESNIYKRVEAYPNVRIYSGFEVRGLLTDKKKRRVTAVKLRNRQDRNQGEIILQADLVVDASGRRSKAPEWLAELGLAAPEEWTINPKVGYATRVFKQPKSFQGGWKTMYVNPTPPTGSRGGIIIPMENGRWQVTLVGIGGDYPPTDDEAFMEFARSLPTARFYEAIKDAEPEGNICGFRRATNRVRRYDVLPTHLEGFLVSGDAAYALNPIYAMGMTAAIVGSRALEQSLQKQVRKTGAGVITGLAATFQASLSTAVARLWQLSTQKDWLWPTTEITDNTEQLAAIA